MVMNVKTFFFNVHHHRTNHFVKTFIALDRYNFTDKYKVLEFRAEFPMPNK